MAVWVSPLTQNSSPIWLMVIEVDHRSVLVWPQSVLESG